MLLVRVCGFQSRFDHDCRDLLTVTDTSLDHPYYQNIHLLHSHLQVGQAYLFSKLKASKMKLPTGEYKKILVFGSDSRVSAIVDPPPQRCLNLDQELSTEDYGFVDCLRQSATISYVGTITRIINDLFGIYELDGRHQLYACFHQHSLDLMLSEGTTLALFNVHLLKDCTAGNTPKAIFVACHFSTIQIKSFSQSSRESTKLLSNQSSNKRRDISLKYSSIQHIILAQRVQTSLQKVLTHSQTPRIDNLFKNLTQELTAFIGPTSYSNHESKEDVTLFDFMRHGQGCRFVSADSNDALTKILTPNDIVELISQLDLTKIKNEKGYGHAVYSQTDLGVPGSTLIGILDSDESGQLKLRDCMNGFVFCVPDRANPSDLSLNDCQKFYAFRSFFIVIEICGYVQMEDYSLKGYLRLDFSTSKSRDIVPKDDPQHYSHLVKILYVRPLILDFNQPDQSRTSCILECMAWQSDKMGLPQGQPRTAWLKLSGHSLSQLPFIQSGAFYWVAGRILEKPGLEDLILEVSSSNAVGIVSGERLLGIVRHLDSSTMFPLELPTIELSTFLSGYDFYRFDEGLGNQLVSLQGRVLSKSIASVAPWKLECPLPPRVLSETFNIGMGYLDRRIVIRLEDSSTFATFNVYCDFRKQTFVREILPGSVIQLQRLGFQVSKSRNLYGVCLPFTSIQMISLPNLSEEKQDKDKKYPLATLADMPRFSDTFQILCQLAHVKKISLKKSPCHSPLDDQEDLICNASIRIEDGTMESFGFLDNLASLWSLLRANAHQQETLLRAVKDFGEIFYANDDHSHNESSPRNLAHQPFAFQSAHQLLHNLCESAIGPGLCLAVCKRKETQENLRIRHLKIRGTDATVPTVCPPALSLKILSWKPDLPAEELFLALRLNS